MKSFFLKYYFNQNKPNSCTYIPVFNSNLFYEFKYRSHISVQVFTSWNENDPADICN